MENPDNFFRGLVMCPDCGLVHIFIEKIYIHEREIKNGRGIIALQTSSLVLYLAK